MSNTFDKLSVLDSFIEEVNSYLPEIETNLERLTQSPADMDALKETHRLTHTIGGSASMMDFPSLAHVAHGMEDVLYDALDGLLTLDEPSLGLLRRSLGRLHQLLEGIRNGIDEEAVIAEDDADYTRYRALVEAPAPVTQSADDYGSTNGFPLATPAPTPALPFAFDLSTPPANSAQSLPSFDDVLASFRTPAVSSGEDLDWPEDAPLVSRFDEATSTHQSIPLSSLSVSPSIPEISQEPTSAFDALMSSTRRASSPLPAQSGALQAAVSQSGLLSSPVQEPVQPVAPLNPAPSPYQEELSQQSTDLARALSPASNYPSVSIDQHLAVSSQEQALPEVLTQVQHDAQALESQASSLKDVVAQLRDAISVVEAQRSEFKGFLNGSKDALDRMEVWAGKAMGLNLRNSPEQVRRYLPLSVMWVSNSKLKKVLDLLQKVTSGVQLTDEQFVSAFKQLHVSIQSCGEAFEQLQAQPTSAQAQDAVWNPWDVQVSQDPHQLRERVTFEREGNLSALRAEVEAQVREDLQKEYDSRNVPQVVRAELEQQIRAELRQEFEERQRAQEQAATTPVLDDEVLKNLEARLRSEVEIQVRQEFLSQIMNSGDDPASLARNMSPNRQQSQDGHGSGVMQATVAPNLQAQLPVIPAAPVPSAPAKQAPAQSAPSPMADFGEEAAEIFRLEAEEHLQTISMHVAALEKNPNNRDLIQGIRRATHTLKGAAGMMGFRQIADLSHISEDLLDLIMEGTIEITPTVISLILDTAEALDVLITGNDDTATGDARVRELHARYTEFLGDRSTTTQILDYLDAEDEDHPDAAHVSSVVASDQEQQGDVRPGRPAHSDLSVRVRLQKLDELVNLFGEMLVSRSVLEERIQRLVRLVADVTVSSNRLADVGQKLESRFEAATLPSGRSVQAMPGEGDQSIARGGSASPNAKNGNTPSHLSDFDELELDRYTEFHQLARGLSEGISDMSTLSTEMDSMIRESEGVFARESRLSTTFQDRLMKVRLVPLSTMTPRLYRAARAVAFKQGKEVDFVMEGETTEVDRTVYEEIFGPLLHLVRNAVNHAIETPEVRRLRGKPTTGTIKLSASYDGNQIVITVRDDGNGIDREHVRQTAINRGLLRPDQHIGEDDVISLIFRPGFSTAEVLSEESGRGVGLDVVRDSVSRLRGTLVVESTPGQGTAFTMTFPISLAIQSAMMVRVGTQQFAIPTVNVESIGRLDNFKRSASNGQPAVVVRNEPYPLHMLAQYLSLPTSPILEEKAQLLLVNAGGHRVALIIDEIKGKFDIVMKNLGPHLRDVHGISGGTILGNGQVILVLELSALLSSNVYSASAIGVRRETALAQQQVRQRVDVSAKGQSQPVRSTPAAATTPERGKHILVVDDSPSVRRVVSNMLKQHNWTVQMARDGVEALEMISQETPAAVLLDIEMPRMDGYELISTVRAQEQYRTLPLIVLTSRAAAKHQQRARSLGASAYVVKPYQDEELLKTISSLVFGTPRS